jgi:hypothetical protein
VDERKPKRFSFPLFKIFTFWWTRGQAHLGKKWPSHGPMAQQENPNPNFDSSESKRTSATSTKPKIPQIFFLIYNRSNEKEKK